MKTTFSERELLKASTMTISITRGTTQRLAMRIGMRLMSIGARIAGVGRVVIDGEEPHISEGEAWD